MPLVPKEDLKRVYEYVSDSIDIDRRTAAVVGDNDDVDTMARLVVARVNHESHEVWPHGCQTFLEAVGDAALSVLVRERTKLDQPNLRITLKRIGHEADFQPRHEYPNNEKVQRRQRDLLGCIRIIAGQLQRREAANRVAARARKG